MFDANNDGFVSPLDVLTVVNGLNSGPTNGMDGSFPPKDSGSGSGSGSNESHDKPPFAVDDLLVGQFALQLPDRVEGAIGETIEFRDASRAPRIKINYDGDRLASVGIYLSWSPPEGYYIGDRFVGEIGTTASPETASFYPAAGGAAWIYGDVPGVNRILANLYYQPAAGFSAPDGISLDTKAFRYSEIGIKLGTLFGSTVVVVNKDTSALGPQAVDDFFTSRSSKTGELIDVLGNDILTRIADPSSILVDVTPAVHSDALIEWDPIARKIRYQSMGYDFLGFDQFAYTLRSSSVVASRAIVTVLLK